MDSEGDMILRMSDNMAMDMDSGEIHMISDWNNDDDDEHNYYSMDDDNDY